MSCNNHTDILDELIKNELANLSVHIVKDFEDPQSRAEANAEFPYITFLMSDFNFDTNSLRVLQKIDVFGFVKSADDLEEKRAILLTDTATALKRKIKFDSGSINNIFRPFGLTAFMDKPYAGFRLSGLIAFDLRQTPVFTITQQAVNWLLLNGSQFQFLNGTDAQFIGTP